jgi:hypothetical protein
MKFISKLDGCEVFMYTDNQPVEGAYYRGSALSRALFELIVTLYKLRMKYDFLLHMLWIVCTRMIHQGTDGSSRGYTNGLATSSVYLSRMLPRHFQPRSEPQSC